MPNLFDSFPLLGGSAKNRIALAPLTRGRNGETRMPNDLLVEYYSQRSGAGLLISEATAVNERGYSWIGAPGIYTEGMANAWRKVTDCVHQNGSLMVCQLWHVGRAGHSDFFDGQPPLGPSAIRIGFDHVHTPKGKKEHEIPRAMGKEEIARTVEDFAHATRLAKIAGFDGVELHGANGYLINEFLDPHSNQREDDYGGSIENRFRFLNEVLDACISEWSADRVGIKLSPNGVYNDMGHEGFHETYTFVARRLNERGLAYLHLMDGLAFGFHEKGTPMTLDDFRPLFAGPIIGNCGYTPESAKQVVEKGSADLIAFGRPFITNPDLPERIQNNLPLAPFDDMTYWYTPGSKGYTDYPKAV